MVSGVLYDVIGRRIPLIFYYVCISLSWYLLTLGWGKEDETLWYGFFISGLGLGMNLNIATMPYIPDLIKEESQGTA